MYLPDDLVDVPVDRIVANLEARLSRSPDAAHLHHALARAHAIAYARGVSSLKLSRPRGSDEPPDEGQLARGPLPARGQGSATPSAAARRHLEEALKHYGEATRLDPEDLTAALGRAWAIEQSGDEVEARDRYRAVIRRALEKEDYFLAREAGGYLLKLLSPFAEAKQVAELKRTLFDIEMKIQDYEKRRAVTPILIPLVPGASFEDLVSREAAVAFDLDGSGLAQRWQWITPAAGWLVYRGTGERRVDSGIRILGSRTFWIFWSDGYDALAALDDDGDGIVAGRELNALAIWRDGNGNGVAEAGEIRPVRDWGVSALSCARVPHPAGFPYSPHGVTFDDGSVRPTYDWIATTAPSAHTRR